MAPSARASSAGSSPQWGWPGKPTVTSSSPILRTWKVFERSDFGPEGEQAREQLAQFLAGLDAQATKFVESRERMRARMAAKGQVSVQV